MATTVLLKATRPGAASAASPEMGYLLSLLRLHAERAFGEVAVAEAGPDAVPDLPADLGAALLVGPGDVLVTEATLRALGDALDGGARAAVPARLADTGLAAERPVYTLRGYERLEARQLAAPAGGTPEELLPVALVAPDLLRRLVADPSFPARLHAADLPLPAGVPAVRAGLCHEFIDYYGEVRSDVVPLLPAGARDVLEVGCGRGATGRHLQETLGCRVTGVELNPAAARTAAEHLHRVVVGDVEDPATRAELHPPYDALLASELFEHLVAPESFLAQARTLVRPGGRIVLSVPNVGHYSVVEDLLAGRWDYLPIGILCYTHYRFFTRATLADWLARCGFPDARLIPQHTEPPPWRPADLPSGLDADPESLRTKGFYVIAEVGQGQEPG